VIITVISIIHLSSSPFIPNLKCITWNFDGSNFVEEDTKDEDLEKMRFENGETIPNPESYFGKYY
jgi:hypothetical protein